MKNNTSVIAAFLLCFSTGSFAAGCKTQEAEFQSTMKSMFKCTNDEHYKVFDMDTSPTDIATAVIYSCNEKISENVKKQYDMAICNSANSDGISISEEEKKHPWYIEKTKIESATKDLLKEKYISDTVSYRAKIKKS
jgi:hypothetical protein